MSIYKDINEKKLITGLLSSKLKVKELDVCQIGNQRNILNLHDFKDDYNEEDIQQIAVPIIKNFQFNKSVKYHDFDNRDDNMKCMRILKKLMNMKEYHNIIVHSIHPNSIEHNNINIF